MWNAMLTLKIAEEQRHDQLIEAAKWRESHGGCEVRRQLFVLTNLWKVLQSVRTGRSDTAKKMEWIQGVT